MEAPSNTTVERIQLGTPEFQHRRQMSAFRQARSATVESINAREKVPAQGRFGTDRDGCQGCFAVSVGAG